MLVSMTGYGNGAAVRDGISATAELRSVNNRFFEFSVRLPKHLQNREAELKELVRGKSSRGKVTLSVSIDREGGANSPLRVNADAAKSYYAALKELAACVGARDDVSLETLLQFSDVFMADDAQAADEREWEAVLEAVNGAVDMLSRMKTDEGGVLTNDLISRVNLMASTIDEIEAAARGKVQLERTRLHERVQLLLEGDTVDPDRLELEIVLLADKLDITEEVVRFRSHLKFFLEALDSAASEGRKLSFLLQELNREANTVGSKSYDAGIARLVVTIKEELERIREQIQNVE
jgi:uncharacterized protein (TIGR00255 family)